MKVEIKNRWTGAVRFTWECDSTKEAVEAAGSVDITVSSPPYAARRASHDG